MSETGGFGIPEQLNFRENEIRASVDVLLEESGAIEVDGVTSAFFTYNDLDTDIQWSAEYGRVITEIFIERTRNRLAAPDIRVTRNTNFLSGTKSKLAIHGQSATLKGWSGNREFRDGIYVFDDECRAPTALMIPGQGVTSDKKTTRAVPFITGGNKNPVQATDSKGRLIKQGKANRRWLQDVEERFADASQVEILDFMKSSLEAASPHDPNLVSGVEKKKE